MEGGVEGGLEGGVEGGLEGGVEGGVEGGMEGGMEGRLAWQCFPQYTWSRAPRPVCFSESNIILHDDFVYCRATAAI